MAARLDAVKGRVLEVTVELGEAPAAGTTWLAELRAELSPTSTLIGAFDVDDSGASVDPYPVVLTLDDTITAAPAAESGYFDLVSIDTSGNHYSEFAEPVWVRFVEMPTATTPT